MSVIVDEVNRNITVTVTSVANDTIVEVGNVIGGSVNAKKSTINDLRASNNIKTDVIYTTADFGVPVNWIADLDDTTSADDTGSVLVTADGTRLKAIFDGHVNVRRFGAVGDGVTDDTGAIQKAFDFLGRNRNSPPGYFRQGVGTLYFPKGRYQILSTLDTSQSYGFKMTGDGMYATSIEYNSDSGVVFNINQYLYLSAEDMSFLHVTETHRSSWTNILFDCYNVGGGKGITMRNCSIDKFGRQFMINDNVNGDHFLFEQCRFTNYNIHWESANSQSLIHTWNGCQWSGLTNVAFNLYAAAWYNFDRMTHIATGSLFQLNSGASKWSKASVFNIKNLKSEWTQGDLADAEFLDSNKWIECVGDNNIVARFNFYGCGISGGYTGGTVDENNIPLFKLKGNVGIEFIGGNIEGGKIQNYRSSSQIAGAASTLGLPNFRFVNSNAIPAERIEILAEVGDETRPFTPITYKDCLNQFDFQYKPDHMVIRSNRSENITTINHELGNNNLILSSESIKSYSVPFHGVKTKINSIHLSLLNQPGKIVRTVSVYSDSGKTNMVGFISVNVAGRYEIIIDPALTVTEGLFIDCEQQGAQSILGYIEINHTQQGV